MRDLVLGVVLLASRRGIAAPDDSDGAGAGGSHDCVHHVLGADLKLRHLKDAHRAVPDDGLGLINGLLVHLHGLLAAVQAHEAVGDALLLRGGLDLPVLPKLGGDGEIHGEHDLHAQLLGLLHDVRHDLRALLVVEGRADSHAIGDLEEGVGHAAANDHLVHLVQHVHDELNLVADLGTTQDSKDGLRWVVQDLREGLQLLGHEGTGALLVKTLADHGAVRAVRGAEGVIAVDVRELADGGAEGGDLVLVRLQLVALGVHALALLLDVEAKVLQQEDGADRGVLAGRLNLGTAAIFQERHGLAELLPDDLRNGLQRVLRHYTTIRPPEMRREYHGLRAAFQHSLNRGDRAVDALRVGDDSRVLLVLRDVEVHAHEDALAGHVDILDLELGRHGERRVRRRDVQERGRAER
mmetsp:Transcript_89931/g.279911  ORF Transcript_89931/g.279911 Transcript_89931/m.279911 type:complete len:410 (-) Transcript_89931:11-1240(-)